MEILSCITWKLWDFIRRNSQKPWSGGKYCRYMLIRNPLWLMSWNERLKSLSWVTNSSHQTCARVSGKCCTLSKSKWMNEWVHLSGAGSVFYNSFYIHVFHVNISRWWITHFHSIKVSRCVIVYTLLSLLFLRWRLSQKFIILHSIMRMKSNPL